MAQSQRFYTDKSFGTVHCDRLNGTSLNLMLHNHRWIRSGVVVASFVFLVACSGAESSRDANIPQQIGADYSSLEPVNIVVNLYESKRDVHLAHITVQGRASLVKALQQGQLDSIFVLGDSNLTEYFRTPIARLEITFITNTSISVTELSYDEIVKIFSGEISNWKMVGGQNIQVQAVAYPAFSSERTVLEELGLGAPPSNALTGNSPEEVIRHVATEPGGIGYVFGTPPGNSVAVVVIANPDSIGPIGLLQLRPAQVSVMFVSLSEPTGDMRTLLDLALNPETQAQIRSGR